MADYTVMFDHLFSRSGLSLDRLRSFLLFAEAGSISRAAPGDVVRQSQLSRQLSELASFFGAELTLRRGKVLTLSPAGRRLAQLVRAQLQDLDDFQREQAQRKKRYVVAASQSVQDWLILPHLAQLRRVLDEASLVLMYGRSSQLVEGVAEGRMDFAILRADALPKGAKRLPLLPITFHLCIPRRLLRRGLPQQAADDPALWQKLPFTAGQDGGQLDKALRRAMQEAGVDFHPVVECQSMQQARQLILQGDCAGVLPSLALAGLDAKDVVVRDFAPLRHYGRQLVLHYHDRHLQRRGVELGTVKALARCLISPSSS